jgi:hypothetical protein
MLTVVPDVFVEDRFCRTSCHTVGTRILEHSGHGSFGVVCRCNPDQSLVQEHRMRPSVTLNVLRECRS